jgi:hypothetical protein
MNSSGYFASWVWILFLLCLFLAWPIELCHDLLKYRCNYFEHELFALGAWTDWLGTCCLLFLKGSRTHISPNVAVQVCATEGDWGYYCCCVLLRCTAAKDCSGMLWLKEHTLPVVVLCAPYHFLFRIYSLACLQPREFDGWGSSPFTNLQLKHVCADAVLPFSGHSLCRRPPLYHTQWGGCWHLAQTWPNFWQL